MIFVGNRRDRRLPHRDQRPSPTGLQEIARFDGVHLERAIWDAIEAKR